jgi:hypothetical protein
MLGFRFARTVLIEFEVLSAVIKKTSVFWVVRLCSSETVRLAFRRLLLFSCLVFSSTLKMEAICSEKRWAPELHVMIIQNNICFI